MTQCPTKKSTLELLSYLTEQERAELAMLTMPPSNACFCLTIHLPGMDREAETESAVAAYVKQHRYFPPTVVHVEFVAAHPKI